MAKNSKRSAATRAEKPSKKKSCYARKLGSGVPASTAKEHEVLVPLKQPLVRIPRSPMGIVDTMRVQLDWIADNQDLQDLLATGDWKQHSDSAFKTFRRSTAGLRVTLREGTVMVEVSVPRLLGLHSDEQHLVSKDDLIRAFQMLTHELLPRTTTDALGLGKHWHVTRLDLAINFGGRVQAIIDVARKLNYHPLIQSAAQTYEGIGIAFYGTNHDAIVYSVTKRPRRSKLARETKEQSFASVSLRNIRFEFRYKKPIAIQRLVEGMRTADRGLPFKVKTQDGAEVRTLAIDYELLHRKLATQALRLGERDVADATIKAKGSSRFLILALARWGDDIPAMWSIAADCFEEDTLRKKKQLVGRVQAASRRRSIVDTAWACPQISPDLRKRLLEQATLDPELRISA